MFIPSGCIMAMASGEKKPVEQQQIPDREGRIRCSLYTQEDAAVSSPPGLHLYFPSSELKQTPTITSLLSVPALRKVLGWGVKRN